MPTLANEECRAVQVARAFFQAATKLSDDNEDILPQEDGVDQKLSVFHLFSELFPEYANDKDRDGGNTGAWQRCVAVAAAGGELSRDAEIESRD
jgi:hypothetical protein